MSASTEVFDPVAVRPLQWRDYLLKLMLSQRRAGRSPVPPHPIKKPQPREKVVKALVRCQYTIVQQDPCFCMFTNAQQTGYILL